MSKLVFDSYDGQQIVISYQEKGEGITLFSSQTDGKVTGYAVQHISEIRREGIEITSLMNANYFVMSSGMALGVRCGYDEWSVPRQNAWFVYGLHKSGESFVCIDSDFWYSKSECVFACSPAMILIFDGDTFNWTSPSAGSSKATANTQSMLLRLTDGQFAEAVCVGRMTPDQCRAWARSKGNVRDLILMDSGGSSCLMVGNDVVVNTSRKVSNFIGFYKKAEESDMESLPDTEVKAGATLNGIDVSNWQAGLNLENIKCDFVIAKATEGIGYVDPYCDVFIQKAKKMGKLWGFYHFARPTNDAVREADWFVRNCSDYFGEGIPVLDWEAENKNDVGWALRWLNRVTEMTGVKPMIYMSESVVNAYDWSSVVAGDYGLWVAKYRDSIPDPNYDMSLAGNAPKVKWWSGYAMWQWTSVGKLDGYSGSLDCDIFYGDKTAWLKYAGAKVELPDTDTGDTDEIDALKAQITLLTAEKEELNTLYTEMKKRVEKAEKALRGEL